MDSCRYWLECQEVGDCLFLYKYLSRTISVVPPWYLHCVKVTYDSFLQLKINCTHSTSNTEYFVSKTIDQKLIVSSIIC